MLGDGAVWPVPPAGSVPPGSPADWSPQHTPASAPAKAPPIAVAAAVLGYLSAALYVLALLLSLSVAAVLGVPDDAGDRAWWLAAVLVSGLLAGLLLLGGIHLVDGRGRVLAVVATALDLAATIATVVVMQVMWPIDPDTDLGGAAGDLVDLVVWWSILLFALSVGYVLLRLFLVLAPSVSRWLQA